MSTVPVTSVQYPPIEVAAARAWWAARFLIGLSLEAIRTLLRALWRVGQWLWALPRENQGVLTVTLTAAGMGVYAVREMLADPRTWAQVFGPPGWVVGVVTSLFIARVARRPIVVLVPFGAALWALFPPQVFVALVGVSLITVYWTTSKRTAHGHMTERRTLTGATESTAHFAPSPGKQHCSQKTAQHEGGHAAAAVAVGGHVTKARAFADGSGYCSARIPVGKTPFEHAVMRVAFYAGGELAVHSRDGCSADQALIRSNLDTLPSGQRPMARTAGYAKGRSAQSTHAHVRNRVADALIKAGRYGA